MKLSNNSRLSEVGSGMIQVLVILAIAFVVLMVVAREIEIVVFGLVALAFGKLFFD